MVLTKTCVLLFFLSGGVGFLVFFQVHLFWGVQLGISMTFLGAVLPTPPYCHAGQRAATFVALVGAPRMLKRLGWTMVQVVFPPW